MIRIIMVSLILLSICSSTQIYAEESKVSAPAQKKSREQLEKELAATLTNAVLSGQFTVDGQADSKPPRDEKYTITEAKKLQGNLWLLMTRIQYGDHDVTVPLSIPIEWSGDTPMISLTNFTIPGMGTFSSRVLIYEGRYAGTWQHGEVGGCLFGRITRNLPEKTGK